MTYSSCNECIVHSNYNIVLFLFPPRSIDFSTEIWKERLFTCKQYASTIRSRAILLIESSCHSSPYAAPPARPASGIMICSLTFATVDSTMSSFQSEISIVAAVFNQYLHMRRNQDHESINNSLLVHLSTHI